MSDSIFDRAKGLTVCLFIFALSAPAEQLQIVGWGSNSYNERDAPTDLTNAVSVCASAGDNLAVLTTGGVREWGYTLYPAPTLTGVRQVSSRFGHWLALLNDGTVTAWGANYYGGLNVPAGLNNVVAVAAGDHHSLALKNDGTAVGWGGQDGSGNVPAGLTGIAAIAGGVSHSLVLRSNGTVVAWGWNANGQANVPAGLTDVVAISAGGYHSMALKADGTVVVWGGQDSSVQPPPRLSGVAQISAGRWHNLALLSNGTVVAWGSTSRGEVNVPLGLKDVVAISAGTQVSLALTKSLVPLIRSHPASQAVNGGSTLNLSVEALGPPPLTYQWWKDGTPMSGANAAALAIENAGSTDAGNYRVVVSSFAGSATSEVASVTVAQLTTGGALISLGGPEIPSGLTDVIQVDACSSHALALKADGTVVGWGTFPGIVPSAAVVPPSLGQVIGIAVENNFSLALRSDGTVVGWGAGSPAVVPGNVSNVIQIAASERHGLALLADGRVMQWRGGVATDVGLTYATAIDGGLDSAVALMSDGRVAAWGGIYGSGGQYYISGLAGITAISYGRTYLLALRNDGTIAGAPEGLSNVTAVAAGGGSSAIGLAMRQDGSLVSWGGAPNTAGFSNVTRINANGGYGLVITRWPAITRHPGSNRVYVGESVTLDAEVKGAGPFAYQWRKDGSAIAGATQRRLTLSNVQFADAGKYTLVASNAYGATESLPGQVVLFGMPEILLQPIRQVVFTGAKVVFSTAAIGAQPLYYQWFHGTVAIPGATSSNLVLASTAASDEGAYSVVISNHIGHVISDEVTLTLTSTHVWPVKVPGTVIGIHGPVIPPDLTNIVAIAAGGAHGLGVRADGTVTSWGRIRYRGAYYPGYAPTGLSNVVAVSVAENLGGDLSANLALRADGTVARWVTAGEAQDIAGLFGIIAIDGGLFLRSDRTVLGISNVVSMDAVGSSTVFVKSDGTVIITGFGVSGGNNFSNLIAASMGTGPSIYTMLLRADGHVMAGTLPGLVLTPYDPTIADLSNVVAIAAGYNFGLALKDDGKVAGVGIDVPADLTGVIAVSAGGFGLAITTNPPQPHLAMTVTTSGELGVLSTLSVPNYVLESATGFGGFTEVPGYTNAFYATNSEAFEFKVTPDATMRIYRLRKH